MQGSSYTTELSHLNISIRENGLECLIAPCKTNTLAHLSLLRLRRLNRHTLNLNIRTIRQLLDGHTRPRRHNLTPVLPVRRRQNIRIRNIRQIHTNFDHVLEARASFY